MKSSMRFSPLALVLAGGAIMGLSLGIAMHKAFL